MKFTILTLFPNFYSTPLKESILQRAQDAKQVEIRIINIRDFTTDKHKTCDDRPFGGGPGMVMKPEPIFEAVESITNALTPSERKQIRIITTSAKGKFFTQKKASSLASKYNHIILICGHYEGIDERVNQYLADEELCIGPYILTGGEIPALIVLDAVTRLIPGVVGNQESTKDESFSVGKEREHPQYTRPANFRGMKVPEILLTGHHANIKTWRKNKVGNSD